MPSDKRPSMAVTQSVAENAKAVVRLRGKAPLFLSNCLVQLKNLHLHLEDGGFKEGLLVGANHLPFKATLCSSFCRENDNYCIAYLFNTKPLSTAQIINAWKESCYMYEWVTAIPDSRIMTSYDTHPYTLSSMILDNAFLGVTEIWICKNPSPLKTFLGTAWKNCDGNSLASAFLVITNKHVTVYLYV